MSAAAMTAPETPETPVPESYLTIPESNLWLLEDKISKLNRRAAKLGLAPIEISEISREIRKEYVGRNALDEPVYRSRTWLTLDVSGDKPTIPGWTLIGAIDHNDTHDGSLNILRAARGETVPESYRTARPTCDHCDTRRWRRDTFILRDDSGDSSGYQQVGRNCLQDFLGADTTAAQLVGWLKFIREVSAMGSEYAEAGFTGVGDLQDTGDYLAAVAASIRVDGWLSKGKAYEEGGMSTADLAWRVLYPTPRDLEERDHPRVTPDDVEIAETALAWVRALPATERTNDYIANLYAACARDSFRRKQAGVVASLVGAAYPRAMRDVEESRRKAAEAEARRKVAEEKGISEHVGQPKQRLRDLTVTIEKIRGWEGHWGYTTFVAMRDASNNLLVWYASGDKADDLPEEGTVCNLTGTVKKHATDKYTGEACTHVNRCGIVALD